MCVCVCVCVFESILQVCQMALDISVLKNKHSAGNVAQFARVLSPYTKVAGLIPSQGTYKK